MKLTEIPSKCPTCIQMAFNEQFHPPETQNTTEPSGGAPAPSEGKSPEKSGPTQQV